MALPVGTRLGPYEIVAPIGAGGMGEVYRARDSRLDREVAVKVLSGHYSATADARARFEREARAIAALQHPNICTVHDVGETDAGEVFLVMELLQGETLHQRLAGGALDRTAFLEIAIPLTDALATAHAAEIVHRDIKPGNVFLTARGPKLLDFGIAKTIVHREQVTGAITAAGPRPTEPGVTVGTVAYMSPEQLRGEALDARTDLFSFGLTLFEMAAGRHAFGAGTDAVIAAAILQGQPASFDRVPHRLAGRLEHIVSKALERDRNLRYQHASEIRADLERVKRDVSSPPTVGTAAVAPFARANRVKAAAAVVALALLAAGYWWFVRQAPALTDRDTIVLADFRNTTGDPVFDETLHQGLAVQLQQSPFLSVVPAAQIRRVLLLMDQKADAPLTAERAREVCERTASAAVLEGSIASLGSQYVVGLRATNCRTGDVLDEQQVQAARKEEVLDALSRIARAFRTRIGESLATVEKYSTPLQEATTTSLDALKAYSTGMTLNFSQGGAAALPFLTRAVEIDPEFALAHAMLGLTYSSAGETALSLESTARAYSLRERVSERERFNIAGLYDRQVTGNLDRARQTFELWAKTYPRDVNAHGLLAGFSSQGTGRYPQTIDEAEKAIALDADISFGYVNIGFANVYLGRVDEAARAVDRAVARGIEPPDVFVLRYHISFLKGDRAGMDAAFAGGTSGGEAVLSHAAALVAARSGQLSLARNHARHAVDVSQRAGQREAAATYEAAVAAWDALFGNAMAARQGAAAALDLSKARDVQYAAAFALAIAGDMPRTRALADDLERRFPEDTSARYSYVPALRALSALADGDGTKAVELLQASSAYELAASAIAFRAFFGQFYPVYVRGLAYLARSQATEAAAEFEKILEHRGLLLADPLGALAHLQRGRALAMAGRTGDAKLAYEAFLTLWKDADAGVPILEQARAEYARLR